ncbi:MAG: sensor domain-containing diguanylate cyclase [Hyphomonas sp.]|uniref:sensor domain-containing diguanylate cyclase n=1 Tax=Hyphomonas sp. TaxID=87 RepID=UPI001807B2CD|nr:sensor domain-containing diguanylate cyclase [Hyphomonas sp.]MBA3070138.1 sensor domain-containing diguanylate cyclase [Hyphomonas sp.]MBU3922340.1 sensor domain-containing diguanylate cyclase [Alphaproteobacteria bacterium]MBU4060286.1 sensor domain-containing diguanylate cyclase [Alphaproteobacteria bacterium]MBU4162954.1 sensor domain-containing diguanylate cyclase [Alphaproteobacteria bacterium]
MNYTLPQFEQQKSEVLQRYRILNGAEVHFAGQIAQTAALALGVPIVLASLNERYRNWYRSEYGVNPRDAERLDAFCTHANLSQTAFEIPDVRQDEHFAGDPAVSGSPGIVFFAGAPLRDPEGKRFGTLCLISDRPHEFGEARLQMLQSFAGIMSQDICVRSAARYAVRDLIEAEHDKCDLFDLAMTDPLTKALNRRAFYRLSEREVLRSSRHGKPLTAIMFDIDHFKQVNDVHGHAIGDEVLTQLVSCVTRNIRDEDLLGRLGGEEFALVLPETDLSNAVVLANRLREAVRDLSFPGKDGRFRISISAGISEPTFRDLDIMGALERADAALYRAKQNGRNRVEITPLLSEVPTRAVA